MTKNRNGNFFACSVHTHEFSIDDVFVTRDQFAEVFGNSESAAAAGASSVGTSEAPASQPASGGSPDAGTATSTTTNSDASSTPLLSSPANDNPQPQGAEQSSYDGNDPVIEDEIIPADTQLVEDLPKDETPEGSSEPAEPSIPEPANDNSAPPSAEAI